MGNWPLPDTPRCAEMHLAELALQEDIARRKRDEASRLEKLKEEKARADAEFREMRRAAAKAAGLPSPPATPSVDPLDSSDGRLGLGDAASSLRLAVSSRGRRRQTRKTRCRGRWRPVHKSNCREDPTHWLIYAQVAARAHRRRSGAAARKQLLCPNPSCRPT